MARKIQERRGCRRPLPAMLSDCTLEGQGPAIMEEACPSPQAHERFRPKLGPPGYPLAKIGERRPHVVQQQIRIEIDHLAIERLDRARRDERPLQRRRGGLLGPALPAGGAAGG